MTILIGGSSFPLQTPGVGGDLLALCDPFAAAMLPYYRDVLRQNLSGAYVAAMAGQALGGAAAACRSTLYADLEAYFENLAPRLPLLAIYPRSGDDGGLQTLGHASDSITYQLDYVLPPLTSSTGTIDKRSQAERVGPLLVAVRRMLVAATFQAVDAPATSAALEAAGVTEIDIGRSDFGWFEGSGKEVDQLLPLLRTQIKATVQTRPDLNAGPLLTSVNTSLDVGGQTDGNDDGELLPGAVTFKVTPSP